MKKQIIQLWIILLVLMVANITILYFNTIHRLGWQDMNESIRIPILIGFLIGSLVSAIKPIALGALIAGLVALISYRQLAYVTKYFFWWPIISLVIGVVILFTNLSILSATINTPKPKDFETAVLDGAHITTDCNSVIHNDDCNSVRVGRFYNQYYLVERNDSAQIHISLEDQDTQYYRINWLSACSYALIDWETGQDELEMLIAGQQNYVITGISDSGYTFVNCEAVFEEQMVYYLDSLELRK